MATTESARPPVNTVQRAPPKKQSSLNSADVPPTVPIDSPSGTPADTSASLARRASHRDHTKTSSLSLTTSNNITAGNQSDSGSTGSLKRAPYNKINNVNVMGKIKDRTGVPV